MRAAYYKDLIVWQKSILLTEKIYQLTEEISDRERFGLISQMQRAAVSIASNIAEGYMRKSDREYKHFLYTALGSAAEIETQLVICQRLRLLDESLIHSSESTLVEIIKMLRTMVKGYA